MKGRQGRLTKTALKKMKRSCGKAICNHVNRSIHSQEERDATVHAMQTEILNMPFSTSKDTWHGHEDALLQALSEVVQVEMEKNRKEARKLAMTYEGIIEKTRTL